MKTNDNRNSTAMVEIIDHGPLRITGNILLRDPKKEISDNPVEVYLCRCGRSCNKPYCDGSHKN
jgi:CDGSH-type Zn-finger protein